MSGTAKKKQDYEVGKGKPPKDKQWKKGQSGNPGGRPAKQTKALSLQEYTVLELMKIVPINENGQINEAEILQLIAKQLVRDSIKENPKDRARAIELMSKLGVFAAHAQKLEELASPATGPFLTEEHRRLLLIAFDDMPVTDDPEDHE